MKKSSTTEQRILLTLVLPYQTSYERQTLVCMMGDERLPMEERSAGLWTLDLPLSIRSHKELRYSYRVEEEGDIVHIAPCRHRHTCKTPADDHHAGLLLILYCHTLSILWLRQR